MGGDVIRRKPKRDGGKGTAKVTTICDKRQRNGYNLQALERGMTPVVLEQFGRTAPGAQASFNRIINHHLQLFVRQGMPFSYAKRVASSELWGPISTTLLRAAWQAHAECAPRIGPSNLMDTPPSLPNSLGESE